MEELIQSLPGPMQLNSTILIIAILFLVLLIILNIMVFRPLTHILDERQRKIDEGEVAQQTSIKTVEESLAAYQARMVDARRAAQERRNTILKESKVVREEIISTAREQAFASVQAAITEIDRQVRECKTTLKEQSQDIAKQIVSSVLARTS